MITIIIPALQEDIFLEKLIPHCLNEHDHKNIVEIIVVQAGAATSTSERLHPKVKVLNCPIRQRARQMNLGARLARSEILFFLHADSIPPQNFSFEILQAVTKGFHAGCFRLKFDTGNYFLSANAWFTRFDFNWFRFGDQGLFVKRELFKRAGGFDETKYLLEDQEIIYRIKKAGEFLVIPKYCFTSTRKYKMNGVIKTQATFYLIWLLYKIGISQRTLIKIYKKLL